MESKQYLSLKEIISKREYPNYDTNFYTLVSLSGIPKQFTVKENSRIISQIEKPFLH